MRKAPASPKKDSRGRPTRNTNARPANARPANTRPTSNSGKPNHARTAEPKRANKARDTNTRDRSENTRSENSRREAHIARVKHPTQIAHEARALPLAKPRQAPGTWIWTTRPFVEADLCEELAAQLGHDRSKTLAPSLVQSDGAPLFAEGDIDTTFARQAFRLHKRIAAPAELLIRELEHAFSECMKRAPGNWALSVFVPDADAHHALIPHADRIREHLRAAVACAPLQQARASGLPVFHVVLVDDALAYCGTTDPSLTVSYADGGKARMRVTGERPSRAARKVEEALFWLGLSPGSGEVCVDMGAAPGGWSWSLLEKRCRVIAVDPALLRPDIAKHAKLTHIRGSAFAYAPDEPVDWLFGDMAWRPLEVAEMAAKWGRRRWARFLVMNFKLPMKKKWEMVVQIRQQLALGGWQRIRTRQLYHDRDEITVTAYL